MTLRINKDIKVSYTLKDIMENEHSELWNKALACVKVLSEVQKHIVDLLPDCRKQLPTHFADLQDEKAQSVLMKHIRFCSLYAFSECIFKMIEKECKDLAECSSCSGSEEAGAAAVLRTTLTKVSEIPFDSLMNDIVTGLLMINEIKDRLHEGLDFIVYSNWSFRDIVGTIDNHGLIDESLWVSVVESQDPICSNLKELLDDDKMVRIY
jgi:hypothetical protein